MANLKWDKPINGFNIFSSVLLNPSESPFSRLEVQLLPHIRVRLLRYNHYFIVQYNFRLYIPYVSQKAFRTYSINHLWSKSYIFYDNVLILCQASIIYFLDPVSFDINLLMRCNYGWRYMLLSIWSPDSGAMQPAVERSNRTCIGDRVCRIIAAAFVSFGKIGWRSGLSFKLIWYRIVNELNNIV